jgi:hypothetical protein
MDTEGTIAPATAGEARERYAALGPTAQVVVKEVAKAMEMDADEYRERVTGDVVETARDALFASLLEVRVGTRAEFADWTDEHGDYEVLQVGSEHVDRVVWHAAPATGTVVAATFQDEREAAVSTLRRQAYGRVYRELVAGDGEGEADRGDAGSGGDDRDPDGSAPDAGA